MSETLRARLERLAPASYEELTRATQEDNKELAEYVRRNLTVVVGDLVVLSPSPYFLKLKR